jgi:hypothetical protein
VLEIREGGREFTHEAFRADGIIEQTPRRGDIRLVPHFFIHAAYQGFVFIACCGLGTPSFVPL